MEDTSTSSENNGKELELARQVDRAMVSAEQELDKLEGEKQQAMQDYELKKKSVIRNLAAYLETLGVPKSKIASRIIRYFQDAGKEYISKSWLYECLHDYVDRERSRQTKEGIAALSKQKAEAQSVMTSAPDVGPAEPIPVVVGTDGNSYTPRIGAVPPGPAGDRVPEHNNSKRESIKAIGNQLISSATLHEERVELPRELWDRFVLAWVAEEARPASD